MSRAAPISFVLLLILGACGTQTSSKSEDFVNPAVYLGTEFGNGAPWHGTPLESVIVHALDNCADYDNSIDFETCFARIVMGGLPQEFADEEYIEAYNDCVNENEIECSNHLLLVE